LELAVVGEISCTEQRRPKPSAQYADREYATAGHFASASRIAMEGIVSCEDLFQWTRAKVTHNALQASASERNKYPNGPSATNAAGMKMKATASKATVVVYWRPVDFNWRSNIATSSVVVVA
jgi:hypothetical protein